MDRLDANRLETRLARPDFWRRIVVLETTGSTNDDARRLAAEGAPEGTVVIAERQTSGRGRLGRVWHSQDRLGLYLSLVLRPAETPDRVGRYAVAAAVAVAAACRELAGDRVVLKWPNDVLAGGRKLAGILAELRRGSSGAELVLGLGINVGHAERDFPESVAASATSLRMLRQGVAIDRETVAVLVLQSVAETVVRMREGAWEEVVERFLRYAPHATGRKVRVASLAEGITDGLDASGALRVRTKDGIVLAHASESVTLLAG